MTRKAPKALKTAVRESVATRRGDPFNRLTDAGIRLATLCTQQAVQELLVKEAAVPVFSVMAQAQR